MSKWVAFLVDGSSAIVELDDLPEGEEAIGLNLHMDFLPTVDGSFIAGEYIVSFQPVVPEAEQPPEKFVKGWFRR